MQPKRQKVALAFLGSVLLHGIALLLFALVVVLRPPAPPALPPDEPLQLEMVQEEPPETPPPVPVLEATPTPTPTPASRFIVDAKGPDTDSTPPPDSALSDRMTRMSSAEQANGNRPGASQQGRRMASFRFDPGPPTPGNDPAEASKPTPLPETAPDLPKPDQTARRSAATPHPYAAAPPEATPAPTANPDEFAMLMATPTPPPEDPFDPSIRSTSPPLPKPVDRTVARSTPTPPVSATRSAENGSGANRGPGGMDTLATPAGRYTRKVADMIKFIWYRSMDARNDAMYGSTLVHCTIDRDGLVIDPKVTTSTADPIFAATALQAVVVARLPAMPEDVVKELAGKRLPMDITFERTPMPQEAALH